MSTKPNLFCGVHDERTPCAGCAKDAHARFGTRIPLEPPLPAVAPGYYAANTYCGNCSHRSCARIQKGTRVNETVCANCGCETLVGDLR